jgi:chorismate-pyruvate lyase
VISVKMSDSLIQPISLSCPKSLKLLTLFLDDHQVNGGRRLELEMLDRRQVPPPYAKLLVHERDMTSTLANYHRQEISLSVLEQRAVQGDILRNVVLRGRQDRKPVEYGAIRIRLDALPEAMRDPVLQGEEPLGGILNATAIQYRSCPGGFLRVRPHPQIVQSLELAGAEGLEWLFGRCNCLTDNRGELFAEVVEILPPVCSDAELSESD